MFVSHNMEFCTKSKKNESVAGWMALVACTMGSRERRHVDMKEEYCYCAYDERNEKEEKKSVRRGELTWISRLSVPE